MKNNKRFSFFIAFFFCLPIAAFSGRYGPYFPHFHSQYVVRGVILKNDIYYHSSFVDLYSPTIKVLNDFNLGIDDTIKLFCDTTGINYNDPILETGWYLKEGEEYYIDFKTNKYGQLCYQRFFDVSDGRVLGNFTNRQEFRIRRFRFLNAFRSRPIGMSEKRFERKLKKKFEERNREVKFQER